MSMLLSLIALKSLAQVNYDQKISFSEPIQSVQSVIGKIAQSTQAPLMASGSLPEWRMYVSCKDVSLKELMDKLADVTYSDWVADQGKLWLKPSASKLNDAKKSDDEATLTEIRRVLAGKVAPDPALEEKSVEELAQEMGEAMSSDNTDWTRFAKLQERAPGRALLKQILQTIDIKPLVGLNSFQRMVYSTSPTSRQIRLDISRTGINWKQTFEDIARWEYAQQAARVVEEVTVEGSTKTDAQGPRDWMAEHRDKKASSQLGLVLVEVTKEVFSTSISARVTLYDEKGAMIHREEQQLFDRSSLEKKPEPPEPKREAIFTLPVEESAFLKKLSTRFDGQEQIVSFTPAELERLRRPDLHEPLSFGATQFAEALAKSRKANSIQILPDVIGLGLASFSSDGAQKLDAEVLLTQMADFLSLNQQQKDGWFLIRPAKPYKVSPDTLPRAEATKWIAKLVDSPDIGVSIQEYMANQEEISFSDIVMLHTMILGATDFSQIFDADMGVSRFYYSLTLEQRRKLDAGQPLSVGSLTVKQRAVLDDLTFGNDHKYSKHAGDAGEEKDWEESLFQRYRDGGFALEQEPTVARPLGVPADAMITLVNSSKTVYQTFDSEEATGYGWDQEEDSLAWVIFQIERPELFGNQSPPRQFFKVGEKRLSRISIRFGPAEGVFGEIVRGKKPLVAKAVPISKLPKEVQDRIQKQVENLKEQYKDAKPGEFDWRGRGPKAKP